MGSRFTCWVVLLVASYIDSADAIAPSWLKIRGGAAWLGKPAPPIDEFPEDFDYGIPHSTERRKPSPAREVESEHEAASEDAVALEATPVPSPLPREKRRSENLKSKGGDTSKFSISAGFPSQSLAWTLVHGVGGAVAMKLFETFRRRGREGAQTGQNARIQELEDKIRDLEKRARRLAKTVQGGRAEAEEQRALIEAMQEVQQLQETQLEQAIEEKAALEAQIRKALEEAEAAAAVQADLEARLEKAAADSAAAAAAAEAERIGTREELSRDLESQQRRAETLANQLAAAQEDLAAAKEDLAACQRQMAADEKRRELDLKDLRAEMEALLLQEKQRLNKRVEEELEQIRKVVSARRSNRDSSPAASTAGSSAALEPGQARRPPRGSGGGGGGGRSESGSGARKPRE